MTAIRETAPIGGLRTARRCCACVLLALGVELLATRSRAECLDGGAAAFEAGRVMYEAKDYALACASFRQSYECDRAKPGRVFALALCEEELGRVSTAAGLYREYLALYEGLPPPRKQDHEVRARMAEEKLPALSIVIPRLTVARKRAPEGSRVTLDGNALPDGDIGRELDMDPGEHTVTLEIGGKRVIEQRVSLKRGDKKVVELAPVERAPPPPKAKAELPELTWDGGRARRIAGYTLVGASAAVAAVGIVTGAIAWSKRSYIFERCPKKKCQDDESFEAVSDVQALGAVSTVGVAIGAAGLVAGGLLLVTAPAPSGQGGRAPEPRGQAAGLGAVLTMGGAW